MVSELLISYHAVIKLFKGKQFTQPYESCFCISSFVSSPFVIEGFTYNMTHSMVLVYGNFNNFHLWDLRTD